ncbi:MAG: type 2 isopentenyl-diphosphate Delta-isomerase [Chloroflexi bacterium RBG_13_56_8]|nr:MAG: type 2 isopentenyl-diphosphate Delta-isomerase [Chloroflexi bacterium RBG_13_56_8]
MDEQRKREHLRICLEQDVRSTITTGLERYQLVHRALPEIALEQVDTRTRFLGRDLAAPLLVSAMTGGTPLAGEVNRRLASAAQELGLAMVLGSQRAGIETPSLMGTYQVRDVAPDILLLANLGAVQLNYGYGVEECRRAVDSVGADALVLHLNPLQEALQSGGNTNFANLVTKIGWICDELSVPVVVKEVGWGISPEIAVKLHRVGVSALDVAGAGGTSWSEVESRRDTKSLQALAAEAFGGWGIPTAEALVGVREVCPQLPLIASGGVTNGVEVAICLALGGDMVGMAHSLLAPAVDSLAAVVEKLRVVLMQLRVAMFCTGARTIADLDANRLAVRMDV